MIDFKKCIKQLSYSIRYEQSDDVNIDEENITGIEKDVTIIVNNGWNDYDLIHAYVIKNVSKCIFVFKNFYNVRLIVFDTNTYNILRDDIKHDKHKYIPVSKGKNILPTKKKDVKIENLWLLNLPKELFIEWDKLEEIYSKLTWKEILQRYSCSKN